MALPNVENTVLFECEVCVSGYYKPSLAISGFWKRERGKLVNDRKSAIEHLLINSYSLFLKFLFLLLNPLATMNPQKAKTPSNSLRRSNSDRGRSSTSKPDPVAMPATIASTLMPSLTQMPSVSHSKANILSESHSHLPYVSRYKECLARAYGVESKRILSLGSRLSAPNPKEQTMDVQSVEYELATRGRSRIRPSEAGTFTHGDRENSVSRCEEETE